MTENEDVANEFGYRKKYLVYGSLSDNSDAINSIN
jgi:hypothetical protein